MCLSGQSVNTNVRLGWFLKKGSTLYSGARYVALWASCFYISSAIAALYFQPMFAWIDYSKFSTKFVHFGQIRQQSSLNRHLIAWLTHFLLPLCNHCVSTRGRTGRVFCHLLQLKTIIIIYKCRYFLAVNTIQYTTKNNFYLLCYVLHVYLSIECIYKIFF